MVISPTLTFHLPRSQTQRSGGWGGEAPEMNVGVWGEKWHQAT